MIKTSLSKGEILAALAAGSYGYASSDEDSSPFLRALAWGLGGGLATRLKPSLNEGLSSAVDDIFSGIKKDVVAERARVELL